MKKISELNQLLENKSFIEFARNSNEKSIHYWREYLQTYPDQGDVIQKLKELATILHSAEKALPLYKTKYELRNLNEAIDYREAHTKSLSRKSTSGSLKFIWLKVAAIFILFFSVAGLSLYLDWLPFSIITKNSSNAIAENQIIVPMGEKCQVVLSDGTKVWLNAGSKFTYPQNFAEGKRNVKLEGEGYFDVVKNPRRPFIIKTDKILVEVLGTSFNLKCYPEDDVVETTLIEGSVKLVRNKNNQNNVFYLNPNEKATYSVSENKIKIYKLPAETATQKNGNANRELKSVIEKKQPIESNIIESIISWKDQELIFNSETLPEIAKKLERWYGYEVILNENPSLDETYTGKFIHNESIEQVLNVLKRTTPISYEIINNKVIISNE